MTFYSKDYLPFIILCLHRLPCSALFTVSLLSLSYFQSRSITFYTKDVEEDQDEQEYQASTEQLLFSRSPRSGKVTLDENNEFHWPLYLLYPEFNQSDFVEDCHEDVRYYFVDFLQLIFCVHMCDLIRKSVGTDNNFSFHFY